MDILTFQQTVCRAASRPELFFMFSGPGDIKEISHQVILPPDNGRVAALGPHPDDPESVAITSRTMASEGCRVSYVIDCLSPSGVTDGYALEAARRTGLKPVDDLGPHKKELRRAEQTASAKLAGFVEEPPVFLELEEDKRGSMIASEANARTIGGALAAIDTDIVLLPHGEDTNIDHALNWRYFRESAMRLAATRGRPLVGLYNRDPKTVRMTEMLVVPFDEEAARWKGELLKTHRTQHERNLEQRGHGFDYRILDLNRETWQRLKAQINAPWTEGFAFAEVFQVECFY
ncbi:MAG: hypothetical protein U9N45_08335 [Gemmatimonadota bacterium]|nr:hypothetical protein [Gemmatimonadota bacterium]